MQIEIFSDVVCPWCYIGKRRLEHALDAFPHAADVTLTYRSFQLDPSAPVRSAQTLEEHLAAKYGRTLDEARQMNQRVTDVAAAVGLEFRLDRAQRGNTLDAHRLLHLAAAEGVQARLAERLMRAYFAEGVPIADHDELTALAVDVGLTGTTVRAVLAGDAYTEDVRADLALARGFGITGVPFFVFDRTYGVSGAQDAAVLAEVMERAWSEARPGAAAARNNEGCVEGACGTP
jgi:predicted DsbA family dithiol-disulfide isomerase